MTKVAKGAIPARVSVAAATVALVMVTGACTSQAPTTTPGAATPTAADDARLFPLVRDTPSDDGTTARRVGFVDQSGRLVVRPTYRAYQVCPAADGPDVVLAWGEGRLDALDADGQTLGSLTDDKTDPAAEAPEVSTVVCGPLAGYATVGTTQGHRVVNLPDLAASGLPVGVGLDASVIWVPATEQGGRRAAAPHLHDAATGTTTRLPDDAASLVIPDQEHPAGTGEWPVPVVDTKGKQRYLDQTGAWLSTQVFAQAGQFVDGHGWVSTGTSWYFVDGRLAKTGQDYTSIVPLLAADGTVTGYQVTSTAGGKNTGLVTVDLQVVVDPSTESVVCAQNTAGVPGSTCVASTADGTARLVALPEGTSTPLPEGMTTVLSDRLVTNAAGSAVHNLTTGQTFDVPAPYRAETAWADAYVAVASDNGLRMVLDGAGETTSLGTITRQVVAADGTMYFWATTRSRQGYVDVAGDWLHQEARYIALED